MKLARLVCSVFVVTLIAGWATQSFACDQEKAAAATAVQTSACSAEMAAKCTPEMMAACKAMKASSATAKRAGVKADAVTAAMSGECAAHAAKATSAAASMDACCESKAGATKASTKGAPKKNTSIIYVNATPDGAGENATAYLASTASGGSCAGKSAASHTASMASGSSCAGKSAASYTASSASGGSCASKGTSVSAVSVSSNGAKLSGHGSCASKGAASASAGQCTGHGMAVMAGMAAKGDCEACFDMAACGDALTAVGAHRQTVRLKNGVMYVFTADSRSDVSAVQAAVARRGDQMVRVLAAGDNVKLCSDCKVFRGAIASGKLTREVVNIEGGTLTLITSSDGALVSRLHAMSSDTKVAARIKS